MHCLKSVEVSSADQPNAREDPHLSPCMCRFHVACTFGGGEQAPALGLASAVHVQLAVAILSSCSSLSSLFRASERQRVHCLKSVEASSGDQPNAREYPHLSPCMRRFHVACTFGGGEQAPALGLASAVHVQLAVELLSSCSSLTSLLRSLGGSACIV